MLTSLLVKNLAIVTELELNFGHGMHVITGETGAGKSIIIDALSIALGERAATEQIRAPHTQAEVTACFDISKLPMVKKLLTEQDLPADECVIRRVISLDGRSRAYINGTAVAVQQIKSLAPHLVQIHSQHQHHALLESDFQRELLDNYAQHQAVVAEVAACYQKWFDIKQQIAELNALQQQADKLTLLNYQIQELDALNLIDNELDTLDSQHKQLAQADELISTCQSITTILGGTVLNEANETANTQSVIDQLHSALQQVQGMQRIAPQLKVCGDLLQQALIQVQETIHELEDYFSKLDLDPAKLNTIEQRLSLIHAAARKLKVAPEQLQLHTKELRQQRDILAQANEHLVRLQQELQNCETAYQTAAQKLTASRLKASSKLAAEIMQQIQALEMPNARVALEFEKLKHQHPSPHGNETVHIMVATNPGQGMNFLKKVASGGELSRISLAIQAITAKQMAIATLILDEVDVGISGKTAAIVGQLMRRLSADAQIVCITHLPQVAAQGHKHLKVEKIQTTEATCTEITPLEAPQRVVELARLMGGTRITPEAMAHAEQLMAEVELA